MIGVHNSELRNNDVVSVFGEASCNGPRCKVRFSPLNEGDYRVVETDY
jgi:hypothetical protein